MILEIMIGIVILGIGYFIVYGLGFLAIFILPHSWIKINENKFISGLKLVGILFFLLLFLIILLGVLEYIGERALEMILK